MNGTTSPSSWNFHQKESRSKNGFLWFSFARPFGWGYRKAYSSGTPRRRLVGHLAAGRRWRPVGRLDWWPDLRRRLDRILRHSDVAPGHWRIHYRSADLRPGHRRTPGPPWLTKPRPTPTRTTLRVSTQKVITALPEHLLRPCKKTLAGTIL